MNFMNLLRSRPTLVANLTALVMAAVVVAEGAYIVHECRGYGSRECAPRDERNRAAITGSAICGNAVPDVAVCPEGRVSPVEEESTQIVVDRSGS